MNLVRLQYGGGSSIEPYTVIVSLDEEFKGQSVTLTQGTEIMRKTCPTTAPYEVEFKPMNDGVWVASSTTKDGKVVSVDTEPLLEWGTYNVTLKSGFNFREWLNRGRVEKTFTSLDDVLADQPTVRQLMTVHDSVDYLVTELSNYTDTAEKIFDNDYCAKWINLRDYALDMLYANANVKAVMDSVDKYGYGEWALIDGTWQPKGAVPIMTANNAPYGKAYCTHHYNNDAWRAFDDNNSTSWYTNNNGQSLQYKFVNPVCVKRMSCTRHNDNTKQGTQKIVISASNDEKTWKILSTEDNLPKGKEETISNTFNFENDNYYLYYRITVSSTSYTDYGQSQFIKLQFYGRELKVSNKDVGIIPPQSGTVVTVGSTLYWEDYSEKEFAQDSKVEYIYDHGVEFDDYPIIFSTNGSATLTRESNKLLVDTKNNGSYAWLIAKLNSGSKLGRMIFGDIVYRSSSDSHYGMLAVTNKNNPTSSSDSVSGNTVLDSLLPNDLNIDTSNYGNGYYWGLLVGSTNRYYCDSIKEWWIEK